MDAVEIAFDKYYTGTSESWNVAFDKIGGICKNKSDGQDRRLYYKNYIIKACKCKGFHYNAAWIHEYAYKCIDSDEDFEEVKEILKSARNWTDLKERLRNR